MATKIFQSRTSSVLAAMKALSESHRVLEVVLVKAYHSSQALTLSTDQKLSILCLIAFLVYCFVICPLFLCPTRDVPGLFFTSTAVGDQLYRYHKARDNGDQWTLSLHERYGPIVRLTPTLMSVSDPSLFLHYQHAKSSLATAASKYRAQDASILKSIIKDVVDDLRVALRGQKIVDVHELLSKHFHEKVPASFATAMAHTIYQLGHPMHRHHLNRLVREVQGAKDNDVQHLRLLNAVVKESLRMQQGHNHHAVTFMIEEQKFRLGKYIIESGVDITTSLYCVARNPTVFSRPNEYDPLQWIEEDKSSLAAWDFIMKYHRSIKLGFDDTLQHLKVLLAKIILSFDMKLPLGEQAKQLDVMELRNGGCRVRFRERKRVIKKKVRFAEHVIM